LSEQLGRPIESFVKLDANENPYGPSPQAAAAVAQARDLHLYPDPESRPLRQALSAATGLPEGYLLAGAGADELIDLVARAIITPGDVIIDCPPSFGMYPFTAAVNGAKLVSAPRLDDFTLDIPAIEHAAMKDKARLLFLCSPNNPDGGLVADATLRRLLQLPLLVILDEAYIEFASAKGASASRMAWVLEYDNLVVLRTFSKVAGLAGLRVGYGAFPSWLIEQLWKIKQPYNINAAATVAAIAALEDRAWLEEKAGLLAEERERLIASLAQFDFLQPYPSRANFVLCRVTGRDAYALKEYLARQGILVRYFAKPFLEDCIRISAGRPADTDLLVKALSDMEA
jgi:histidinol-phosphate aminotransferase